MKYGFLNNLLQENAHVLNNFNNNIFTKFYVHRNWNFQYIKWGRGRLIINPT